MPRSPRSARSAQDAPSPKDQVPSHELPTTHPRQNRRPARDRSTRSGDLAPAEAGHRGVGTPVEDADDAEDDNDLAQEYDFTGGVRGKHVHASQRLREHGYTVAIHHDDGTTEHIHYPPRSAADNDDEERRAADPFALPPPLAQAPAFPALRIPAARAATHTKTAAGVVSRAAARLGDVVDVVDAVDPPEEAPPGSVLHYVPPWPWAPPPSIPPVAFPASAPVPTEHRSPVSYAYLRLVFSRALDTPVPAQVRFIGGAVVPGLTLGMDADEALNCAGEHGWQIKHLALTYALLCRHAFFDQHREL